MLEISLNDLTFAGRRNIAQTFLLQWCFGIKILADNEFCPSHDLQQFGMTKFIVHNGLKQDRRPFMKKRAQDVNPKSNNAFSEANLVQYH